MITALLACRKMPRVSIRTFCLVSAIGAPVRSSLAAERSLSGSLLELIDAPRHQLISQALV